MALSFVCKRCRHLVHAKYDERIILDGDDWKVVDMAVCKKSSGWKKFKEISGLLCNRGLSLKMKGTMYKKYVRSALSYGVECWAMKMDDVRRMKSTEMRMLHMICGKTVRDKVRNE